MRSTIALAVAGLFTLVNGHTHHAKHTQEKQVSQFLTLQDLPNLPEPEVPFCDMGVAYLKRDCGVLYDEYVN